MCAPGSLADSDDDVVQVLARSVPAPEVVADPSVVREVTYSALREEALGLCDPDDLETLAFVLHPLAVLQRQAGDFDRSTQLYERALHVSGRLGLREMSSRCRLGLSAIHKERGQLDEAQAGFEMVSTEFEQLGSRFGRAAALNGLASVRQLQGESEQAEGPYQRSWDLLESIGSPVAIVPGLNLALIYVARGDVEQLGGVLHRIDARIPESVRQPWLPQLLLCRLTILASRRDWAEWDQTLERALTLLPEAIGNPDDLAAVARLAGRTARAAGEAKRAWAVEEVFRAGGGLSSES